MKIPPGYHRQGENRSRADYSLFFKHDEYRGSTFDLVYVDDILIGGDNIDEIKALKATLNAQFRIKDLGFPKYFLGIEIARSSRGILLYQRKYSLDILTDMGMLGCRSARTPMEQNLKLSDAPPKPHYDAALRLLHYLKGCPGKGILLSSTSSLQLIAYADSDWASCPITRRPTNGYCSFLGSSPIS
ncbi:uncharacterized mitochondrial protein AtMg00810-like [Cornus florida]|uniref:uncharacterized mitochondrial protein AtMg00810-like n=1 Tax=Cornus florida TaxID=4283 RepID=UPI00289E68E8|nr:uncharacterized mitochondrial protein AtMg00810-like [Cornus florida]